MQQAERNRGRAQYSEPEWITPKLLAELRRITPNAPDHLPTSGPYKVGSDPPSFINTGHPACSISTPRAS